MGKNQTSFKKGHKVPKEWTEKIIKALKGRKIPEERRQKLIGRKLSKEHRKKISQNNGLKGEKHWQWKGGITRNKEYLGLRLVSLSILNFWNSSWSVSDRATLSFLKVFKSCLLIKY
ncbi:unnamed protein product [marine sediment metagenome]|uniref:Nuclease associated modular domain-containing protein n=1 Tax=marine sediment metagenome TaxID=412755 RepID=X1LKU0_9ZZZZ